MCVDWKFSGSIRSYESFSVHGLLEKQSHLNKITQISLYPARRFLRKERSLQKGYNRWKMLRNKENYFKKDRIVRCKGEFWNNSWCRTIKEQFRAGKQLKAPTNCCQINIKHRAKSIEHSKSSTKCRASNIYH